MKKFISLLLILCLAISLFACSSGGSTASSAPASSSAPAPAAATPDSKPATDSAPIPVKVGFCWHTNTDEVFSLYSKYINQIVDEINAEGVYDIKLIETSANADATKQMSDLESLIQQKPDVILLSAVDQEASENLVDAVVNAGIPVVNAYKMTNSTNVTSKIWTMDHYYVGQLYSEWLSNWLNENPDENLVIALINGNPANPDTLNRGVAFEEIFVKEWENSGRITYLGSKNGEQNAEKATRIAEDWLQSNPEINCFVSSSDMMTFPVYNICKAAGRNNMLYVTGDATADVLTQIEAGNMQMTVGMDKKTICQVVMDTCLKAATGEPVEAVINAATAAVVVVDSPEGATEYLKGIGLR